MASCIKVSYTASSGSALRHLRLRRYSEREEHPVTRLVESFLEKIFPGFLEHGVAFFGVDEFREGFQDKPALMHAGMGKDK